jgi:hypothetical protein
MITAGIILAIALLLTAYFIRCIKNAYEEKECEVTESKGLEVTVEGNLVETITATFHQA